MAKNLALLDIQNQSLVPAQRGCEGYEEPLANLRIEILQRKGRQYGLTKADSVAIDSCILFASNAKHIDYLRHLLWRMPPHRAYYQRVKALFLNDHYIEALVTLARYRKPEDVQYVLNALHGRVLLMLRLIEPIMNVFMHQVPRYGRRFSVGFTPKINLLNLIDGLIC